MLMRVPPYETRGLDTRMDLRDFVRHHPSHLLGHEAVEDSLNLNRESREFARDPLLDYCNSFSDSKSTVFIGEIQRYRQSHYWYSMALRRVLEHISLTRRWESSVRFAKATTRHTQYQRLVSSRYRESAPYAYLDYYSLVVYSCMLLDRTIALSRRFLPKEMQPSYTSFSKHRENLLRLRASLSGECLRYALGLIENSDWFNVPLKLIRDKYLMHSSEEHIASLGWPNDNKWDMLLIVLVSATEDRQNWLNRVKCIRLSPRRLARQIQGFLHWFGDYATNSKIVARAQSADGR